MIGTPSSLCPVSPIARGTEVASTNSIYAIPFDLREYLSEIILTSRTFRKEEEIKCQNLTKKKKKKQEEKHRIILKRNTTYFAHSREELLQVSGSDSGSQLHAEHCAGISLFCTQIINRFPVGGKRSQYVSSLRLTFSIFIKQTSSSLFTITSIANKYNPFQSMTKKKSSQVILPDWTLLFLNWTLAFRAFAAIIKKENSGLFEVNRLWLDTRGVHRYSNSWLYLIYQYTNILILHLTLQLR